MPARAPGLVPGEPKGKEYHEQRKIRRQAWWLRQASPRDAQDHLLRLRAGGGGSLQAGRQEARLLQGLLPEAQASEAILVEVTDQRDIFRGTSGGRRVPRAPRTSGSPLFRPSMSPVLEGPSDRPPFHCGIVWRVQRLVRRTPGKRLAATGERSSWGTASPSSPNSRHRYEPRVRI